MTEPETLRKQVKDLCVEVSRLTQMLRETGYGQGKIDAYKEQCEELDALRLQTAVLATENGDLKQKLARLEAANGHLQQELWAARRTEA